MVRVVRGGEEVKISKRAGSYVTLRDLIEWTSKDAVRFFLLSRKPDTEYTFDVDLAVAQNNDNPVYYVQYAHARIQSVLRAWQEAGGGDVASLRTWICRPWKALRPRRSCCNSPNTPKCSPPLRWVKPRTM